LRIRGGSYGFTFGPIVERDDVGTLKNEVAHGRGTNPACAARDYDTLASDRDRHDYPLPSVLRP
jgi:hypothetical protein